LLPSWRTWSQWRSDTGRVVRHGRDCRYVASLLPRGNTVAPRVERVFTTDQLCRLLPGVDRDPITDEAVRQRARNGRLIGLKTRDGR
jgi:hypothetical protein